MTYDRPSHPPVKGMCNGCYTSEHRREIRRSAIQMLGGFCACCGERRFEFLTLDHIENDGASERRLRTQLAIVKLILAGKTDVSKYQILCWNCNCARHWHGECPHKKDAA